MCTGWLKIIPVVSGPVIMLALFLFATQKGMLTQLFHCTYAGLKNRVGLGRYRLVTRPVLHEFRIIAGEGQGK